MNAVMLFTGSGPIVILTSYSDFREPALLARLADKGIDRFLAWELPMDLARERYGGHFQAVMHNLHESDDLRVLDYNGQRAFRLFRLSELGEAFIHEPDD